MSSFHPYDDRDIIAGQGTCGLEIVADRPEVDLVLAPVGGGGLLSGVAAAVKLTRPGGAGDRGRAGTGLGCGAELQGRQHRSLHRRAERRTAADGLRTQSVGALNFAHMQAYVDDIVTVTEAEIREAMRRMIFATRLVPEPSGAVALAAALFHREQLPRCPADGRHHERRQRRAGGAAQCSGRTGLRLFILNELWVPTRLASRCGIRLSSLEDAISARSGSGTLSTADCGFSLVGTYSRFCTSLSIYAHRIHCSFCPPGIRGPSDRGAKIPSSQQWPQSHRHSQHQPLRGAGHLFSPGWLRSRPAGKW